MPVKLNYTATLAARCRQLRETAGFTQPTLARVLGVSVSYINLLESGSRTNPTIEIVDRICTFFGASRDWLLDGRTPMFVDENADTARERYHKMMREKLGSEDDFERREQQAIAEISVRLAQAPHCTPDTWKTYRRQIMAAVDAHAAFCMEHAPEIKVARLRLARALAEKKKS